MLAQNTPNPVAGFTRFSGAAALAAAISVGLLFLMQSLVAGGKFTPSDVVELNLTDVIWEGDPPVEIDDGPQPPDKPVVDIPDIPKPVDIAFGEPGDGITYERNLGDDTAITIADVGPAIVDIGPYPKFRVAHQWPARAPASGGCVVVGFTITAAGGVIAARVLESSSSRFHTKAIEAVSKYKYNPPVANGVPFAAPNQTIRLVWQYDGEDLPDHPACSG